MTVGNKHYSSVDNRNSSKEHGVNSEHTPFTIKRTIKILKREMKPKVLKLLRHEITPSETKLNKTSDNLKNLYM